MGKIKRSLVFFIGLILGIVITYLYFLPEATTEPNMSILVDEDYFPTAIGFIQNAEKSIYIGAFEIKYYDTYKNSYSNQLLDALIDAHKRGVDVRIVSDQYYSTPEAMTYLQEAGVDARWDSESRTMHSKFMVIDGEIVVVGSTNWSYYSMTKNNEANVVIHSKDLAKDFIKYFEDL